MQGIEILGSVEIFFRTRTGAISWFADRREGIEIRFGNTRGSDDPTANPLCATTPSLPNTNHVALPCGAPLSGQHLVLRQPDNKPMEIDEVFAYSYETNSITQQDFGVV